MSNGDFSTTTRSRRRSFRREARPPRFSHWPLLRLMASSPAFRLVVLLVLVVGIAGPLLLLKIWRVSPPDITPVQRISLLDRLQAWSLKRNARAAEARGDYENAKAAWRAALANNPADVIGLREALKVVSRTSQPSESASLALSMGGWLLRLGETNVADLELIASVWNMCELHERTAATLARATNAVSPELNRLRAVAYFRSGQVLEFQQLLEKDAELERTVQASLEPLSSDTQLSRAAEELRAVSLAYLAGWGPLESRTKAEERLREMAEIPRLEALAYQMLMTAYMQRRDVQNCEAALKNLQSVGRASLWNLTAYWRLLALNGRRKEAVELIREANPVPRTDADVIRLVTTYAMLEMYEEADQLCRRYLNDPPWLQEGALIRTDLLTRLQRWDELRQLAYRLRLYPTIMDALGGFSAFLEGLAQWHEGYRDDADRSFETAARTGFPEARLALRVAENLMRLGAFKHAEPILLQENVRTAVGNDPAYLTLRVRCASQLRRGDDLLEATTALYNLAPNNPVTVNNYAAALLLLRTNVEKAVVQTFRLMQFFTNNAAVKLNHVAALTMNGRLDEADALLAEVPPSAMNGDEELAQYYLAVFEIRLRQGRKQDAQDALAELRRIGMSQIYPSQAQWLEQVVPELEALPDQPPAKASGTATATPPTAP